MLMSSPPFGLAMPFVRRGPRDRLDDGETDPVSFRAADPVGTEPLERLEKPIDLVGGMIGPRLLTESRRATRGRRGGDVEVTTVDVVPNRVVDEIGHQAVQQPRIAVDD